MIVYGLDCGKLYDRLLVTGPFMDVRLAKFLCQLSNDDTQVKSSEEAGATGDFSVVEIDTNKTWFVMRNGDGEVLNVAMTLPVCGDDPTGFAQWLYTEEPINLSLKFLDWDSSSHFFNMSFDKLMNIFANNSEARGMITEFDNQNWGEIVDQQVTDFKAGEQR